MSGRSVGRLSAGRRITDHGTRQQSHGRRRSRRVHLSRAVLAPPVLGEGVPGIGRVGIRPRFGDRPISHAEWQTSTGAAGPPTGGSAARHHRSADDDSRYRFARYEHSRRQNIPAAAGHRRRARRSPGRSPGTTDFASRPGFPHDLGWGPLQNGRERGDSGGPRPRRTTVRRRRSQLSSTRVTSRRVRTR